MRDNGQSSLLADGRFLQEDELVIEKLDPSTVDVPLQGGSETGELTECWQITIPDDGAQTHQIRYQAPQGQTEGVEIYVQDSAGWKKAETELMGIYHLFPADGNSIKIAASVAEKGIMDYIFFLIAGAVVVIVLLLLLIHKKRKKRKARLAEAEAESGE